MHRKLAAQRTRAHTHTHRHTHRGHPPRKEGIKSSAKYNPNACERGVIKHHVWAWPCDCVLLSGHLLLMLSSTHGYGWTAKQSVCSYMNVREDTAKGTQEHKAVPQ